MKFTKIPANTFQQLQLNAGVLASAFDISTGEVLEADMLGATSGGINFTATPTFIDMGDDVDNCPKNMKELKKLDSWEAAITGTFVTVNTKQAKSLIGAADIGETNTALVTPRNTLKPTDFSDVWWIGDYSDKNGFDGGFMAIHLKNALSTGGFSVQTGDKAKGQFTFTYMAHYSNTNIDEVPFDVYVKAGTN